MKINRRLLLQALGLSPALLAGSTADAKASKKETANAVEHKLVGLNPKGMPPEITIFPMAPRLDTLEGKTIYLVDIGFNNGDVLFQQIQKWFQENMPSVKTIYRRKIGAYPQDDPKLWAEIKAAGGAVIMGVGH